jgi:MFS family permease
VNSGNLFEQAAGFALLASFYPPAMLIAALYLGSERPGRITVSYVLGGLAMVTIVSVVVLVVLRAGGLSHLGHHQTRYGVRLGLGVVAVIAAVLLWRRQRRPADPAKAPKPKRPSLIERLSARPSPLSAFAVGAFVFGPSLTFIAAVQVVATAKAGLGVTIGAIVMIVLLTVAFGWLPLVAYLIAPQRTATLLRRLDAWLKQHGKKVVTTAIAVVGILLIIQGILGLT